MLKKQHRELTRWGDADISALNEATQSRPDRSILYFPVTNNMVDLVKFLLKAGIDPRKDPDGGKSIAEQAERHGDAEMKALIKSALEKTVAPGN